jgi:hypothetical protein
MIRRLLSLLPRETYDLNYEGDVLRRISFLGFSYHVCHITNGGDLYMRRWWLELPNGDTFRVHNIVRSDADCDLHDHPFDFDSFLWGEYTEILPIDEENPHPFNVRFVHHRRFSIVRHKARDAHRIIVRKPMWTFVWTSLPAQRRTWGFWTPNGRVHHNDYLRARGDA